MARLKRLVKRDYRARLNLDNMPLVVKRHSPSGEDICKNNHGFRHQFGYSLKILYHRPSSLISSNEEDVYRVVGFEVEPVSMAHSGNVGEPNFCPVSPAPQEVSVGKRVYYTYDVTFEESDIRWATRWDPLLKATDEQRQIQWFSIINSLLITLFLSGMVAMILLRTLHKDFMRYNELTDEEDIQEEAGWKLVHGDVFRSPPYSSILCVLVGNGAQVLSMAMVTMSFALIGFLSPANRGALLSCMTALWVLSSSVAASCGGNGNCTSWDCFFSVFHPDTLIWLSQSNVAVPFSTLLLLLFLWFGISVPLVFVGAYIGLKRPAYNIPCRINQIPRKIPPQPWYSSSIFTCLVGGILPFGSVFIQLVFILGSLWQNQVYYMFGFLSVVFIVFIITSMEISVVLCYLKLCSEDYNCMFYLMTQPDFDGIDLLSVLVYFGYMGVISMAFALMAGFVGFYYCFWFVRKIYSSIRVD
eukprot:jgi/Galph1/811/GphlegSOOS_G5582.1